MSASGRGGAMRRGVIAADPRLSLSVSEVESVYSAFASDDIYIACTNNLLKRPYSTVQVEVEGLVPRSFGETLKRHSRI